MSTSAPLSSISPGSLATDNPITENLDDFLALYPDTQEEWDMYEDMVDYRPGGWHPVLLGDLVGNDRYRLVHRLGHGASCTVWLGYNEQGNSNLRIPRYVAVKVFTAMVSMIEMLDCRLLGRKAGRKKTENEASTAGCCVDEKSSELLEDHEEGEDTTGQNAHDNDGQNHIVTELDSFKIQGPSGTHHCIVTKWLGPSLGSLLGRGKKIGVEMKKRAIAHAAKGIAFLHSRGVVHGVKFLFIPINKG